MVFRRPDRSVDSEQRWSEASCCVTPQHRQAGHSIETPNAYRPGSGSVAEETFKALELQQQGRLKRETILVDYREAPEDTDLADHDSLYRGLVHAYGDCTRDNGGWVDIEHIITEIWPPQRTLQMRANFI